MPRIVTIGKEKGVVKSIVGCVERIDSSNSTIFEVDLDVLGS